MYQDLSTHLDSAATIGIVDLPLRLKGNSKFTSGNSLSPLGICNKTKGAASQTVQTEVKLRL